MMVKCVVCVIPLPDSTQRRRLCITSSEQVLLVVCEFVERRCPVLIDQLLSSAAEKCFACRECFSSAERVLKLRSLAEEERKLQAAMLTLARLKY